MANHVFHLSEICHEHAPIL